MGWPVSFRDCDFITIRFIRDTLDSNNFHKNFVGKVLTYELVERVLNSNDGLKFIKDKLSWWDLRIEIEYDQSPEYGFGYLLRKTILENIDILEDIVGYQSESTDDTIDDAKNLQN